ncbi:hypothetical protein CERSUDRAFT_102782 [Gelatoporia subvermispora B]|uniref:Transmembrane protein n=1 Tax=Ceriporiopsis subvermispora (strain B) TaxID=914234 RepID=M2R7G7_CERS8|nr:hypothetical protein CERSUDRAFT_102782 [Gelatoporia subvermispora B]
MELIWGRKFNVVILLFHLNRCVTFGWTVTNLLGTFLSYSENPVVSSTKRLRALYLTLAKVFSGVRVYAVSGGTWWLSIIVCLLNIVPIATNAYYESSISWVVAEIPVVGIVCVGGSSVSNLENIRFDCELVTVGTRTSMITADVIVLLVTWFKTYSVKRDAHRHGIQTPLVTMLLVDGIHFSEALLALNVLQMVGWITNVFIDSTPYFVTPLSSVIMSRFFLNLRQAADGPRGMADLDGNYDSMAFSPNLPPPMRSHQSSLRFASFVGNAGEDLTIGPDTNDPDLQWIADDSGLASEHKPEPAASSAVSSDHSGVWDGFQQDVQLASADRDNTNVSTPV